MKAMPRDDMNLKDKTDAELNEACARVMGKGNIGGGYFCKQFDGKRYNVEPDPNESGEIFCVEPAGDCKKCSKFLPKPFCTSAEAQAELKRWIEKKQVEWSGGRNAKYYWYEIVDYDGPVLLAEATDVDREGRALAEAFVQAFGEKNK